MTQVFRSKQRILIPTHVSVTEAMLLTDPVHIPDDKVIFEESVTGRTATYVTFKDQVKRTASWLKHHLGLAPGDVVTIVSTSSIGYVVATHAVWWLGGVVSMINDALSPKDLAYGLDLVRPKFLILGSGVVEKMNSALELSSHAPSIDSILTMDQLPLDQYLSSNASEGAPEFDELPDVEPYSLQNADNRQVLAAVVLSSGTTGRFKAVMMSHHNLIAANYQLRADNPSNWRPDMREIFFPPLSHVYATYVVMTGAPWLGYYVCLMPRFDLHSFCRLMSERKATMARLVPPVAKMLAESPITKRYQYPFLEYFTCSAAPLSEAIAAKLRKTFPHVALCQTYGCTEASGACVQSGVRDKHMALNATGKIIANIELRFLDQFGQDVGPEGPGEITIRGPNIMMGYLRDPHATKRDMLDGGWYKTGDLGYLNSESYLIVNGRSKDTIKYNGFQVSPMELEEILLQHPAIDEVAVCGVWSDEAATELVRAYVAPKKGVERDGKTAGSIAKFLANQVSGYKHLRGGVIFLDELPKSPTGKVLRRLLRDVCVKAEGSPFAARI
ncbi:hypothetical protein B0J13DRAFT_639310 [Dactylonectria estremocensis]|uniref:Uncharacterized protein n=1 Tax=Dactylonectria estremocensis TaxID=1079267 RepID=A0A9P9EMY5_9HYPO|nr:hypothetical protein B0J13DRAFT_639310 [Dactylonectria estremocensis]